MSKKLIIYSLFTLTVPIVCLITPLNGKVVSNLLLPTLIYLVLFFVSKKMLHAEKKGTRYLISLLNILVSFSMLLIFNLRINHEFNSNRFTTEKMEFVLNRTRGGFKSRTQFFFKATDSSLSITPIQVSSEVAAYYYYHSMDSIYVDILTKYPSIARINHNSLLTLEKDNPMNQVIFFIN